MKFEIENQRTYIKELLQMYLLLCSFSIAAFMTIDHRLGLVKCHDDTNL